MKRILSALLILGLTFTASACNPFADKLTITAVMEDSAGLFVGNDVGILGVPVGEVVEIVPDGKQVRVVMEIDGDQAVPANAGAVVVARSVATDRYVELTPVYRSGAKMADDAEIPLNRTKTPVDFDEVLEAVNTFATGIAGQGEAKDAVKRLVTEGAGTFRGKGQLFNRAVSNLGIAMNSIASERHNITATIESLDTLVGEIDQNRELVGNFITQVSEASQILAAERNNFRSALRGLSDTVELVAEFAKDHRSEVVRSLNQSNDVMRTLLSKQAEVADVLEKMPLALQNLQRVVGPEGLRVRTHVTDIALGNVLELLCDGVPGLDICSLIGADIIQRLNEDPLGVINGLLGGGR